MGNRSFIAFAALVLTLFSGGAVLVSGGAALAANQATIVQQTGDDVFLGGRDVSANSRIKGDLTATGVSIVVGPSSDIGGDVWVAGKRAAVMGRIGGNLDMRVQEGLINGRVEGDVSFVGQQLSLGPEAVIEGTLSYVAPQDADIDRDAQVLGDISQQALGLGGRVPLEEGDENGEAEEDGDPDAGETSLDERSQWHGRHEDRGWFAFRHGDHMPYAGHLNLSVTGAVFLGFLAAIASFAAPGWMRMAQRMMDEAPASAFLAGFGWLFAVPIFAALSAVTVIGMPFAMLVLVMFAFSIVIGSVTAVVVIGGWIVGLFGRRVRPDGSPRILISVLGALVFWGGVSLPLLGGLFWLIAVAGGIGAFLLAGRQRYEL